MKICLYFSLDCKQRDEDDSNDTCFVYTAELKRVGEMLNLATQCILAQNISRTMPSLLSNVCLKINSKLGGIGGILPPSIRYAATATAGRVD